MRKLPLKHRAAALLTAAMLPSAGMAGDVMLQYFEASWETIERRLPDVFIAGYTGIWVPPPGVADSGGFSVGYDVFDRFNLGNPNWRTLYGTTQGFAQVSDEMDRAGMSLYVDTILNHNGFSDQGRPGFVESGDYPGFVLTIPEDVDGDFHSVFAGGDLEGRLAGLIDIAQEKNHVFIRHPAPGVEFDGVDNIPNEPVLESNRQFYPDQDLPEEFGRHPFNLENPLAGDPTPENATGLLLRYLQWLVEVHGVDGYRLDATKHIPLFFFNDFYDAAVHNLGRNPIDGSAFTPFSFGENFTGDFGSLAAYVRKDGFGNRDTLDFPLFFAMDSVFGGGGFGSMRALENASFDAHDGDPNDGSLGVMFAGSHDSNGAGAFNGYNNLAQAHVLTRPGFRIVYYNAKEFGDGRDFPKDGRGDAIGNFGNTLTTLVDINREYGRSFHQTRWVDDDLYIYERAGSMLIGLNDRGDGGFDERDIATGFPPGIELVELTGNASDSFVDPNDDIFDRVTVREDGRISIRVPRNTSANGDFHGRGYVIYGPEAPLAELVIANADGQIDPDSEDVPEFRRRLNALPIVREDTVDVEVRVSETDRVPNDNALLKVNFGQLDLDGDGERNPNGEFAGFESFPEVSEEGNSKTYRVSINAAELEEGVNFLESVAFRQRPADTPPVMDRDRLAIYVDRLPPEQELLFPPRTGERDITTQDYEAVVSVDRTVNSLHILENVDPDAAEEDILNLVSPDNAARRNDRREFRKVLENVTPGILELTVVAFEESGTHSIERYGNIGVELTQPVVELGADYDLDPGSVNFGGLPGSTNDPALDQEIVIRVLNQNVDGEGGNLSFPEDYEVTLSVNGEPAIQAAPFNAELLPPVGRLVQNDQNLGDEFDEFRFVFRGYGRGNQSFLATATLLDGTERTNEVTGNLFVEEGTPGPAVTITTPMPPSETLQAPEEITVAGTFDDDTAAFARIFLDVAEEQIPLGVIRDPEQGPFSVTVPVASLANSDTIAPDSINLSNGTYTVRVVASTGNDGEGISSETQGEFVIDGLGELPFRQRLQADGDASDILGAPLLAASAADGPGMGTPADFGADGTITQLHARVDQGRLVLGVRGDMFGPDEDAFANMSMILIDVDGAGGDGITNVREQLSDQADDLRLQIGSASFVLSEELVGEGFGFDAASAITEPSIGFGFSFGTGGTDGAFDDYAFQPGIVMAYDDDVSGIAAAEGASYAAPNAFETAISLEALGSPDVSQMRFAVVTASDSGYASPNTLPENGSDEFGEDPNTQIIESLAFIPASPMVLINEIAVGDRDFVELFNPGGSPVELAGWSLYLLDSDQETLEFVFGEGTEIPAGGYLVVADGEIETAGSPLLESGFNIPWDPSRGGAAALLDRYGVGADYIAWLDQSGSPGQEANEVPYGTSFQGTIQAPSAASSLGRGADSADTDTAEDWNRSGGADSDRPTPGSINQFTSDPLEAISIF